MPLSSRQRLEAEFGLLPADLGLSTDPQLDVRVGAWETLAGERADILPGQTYEYIKALALRNWIVALMRQVDEFEAVGDIKTKINIQSRIDELLALEKVALRNAGVLTEIESGVSANPAPVIGGWDVDDGA